MQEIIVKITHWQVFIKNCWWISIFTKTINNKLDQVICLRKNKNIFQWIWSSPRILNNIFKGCLKYTLAERDTTKFRKKKHLWSKKSFRPMSSTLDLFVLFPGVLPFPRTEESAYDVTLPLCQVWK